MSHPPFHDVGLRSRQNQWGLEVGGTMQQGDANILINENYIVIYNMPGHCFVKVDWSMHMVNKWGDPYIMNSIDIINKMS